MLGESPESEKLDDDCHPELLPFPVVSVKLYSAGGESASVALVAVTVTWLVESGFTDESVAGLGDGGVASTFSV